MAILCFGSCIARAGAQPSIAGVLSISEAIINFILFMRKRTEIRGKNGCLSGIAINICVANNRQTVSPLSYWSHFTCFAAQNHLFFS